MRMREHVNVARYADREFGWAHMIEEDERPDHTAPRDRQDAPDLEAA
jgi:hypothetical protein